MLLFIDTETTGLHNARIVELAALLTDEYGKELSSMNVLINHHQDVPPEATAIHGITTEMCEDAGVNITVALDMFLALHEKCHTIVAHNMQFEGRREHGKKSSTDRRAPHMPVFLAAMGDIVFPPVTGTFNCLARQQVEVLPDHR